MFFGGGRTGEQGAPRARGPGDVSALPLVTGFFVLS